jgi:DNA-binding transcriptional LysR family regulator
MNLRQIESFVHVAESGSFSRASAQIGLTQPAVSRQVSALEAELRFKLLHRNGRGVLLTDAGRRFLMYAKGILHQLEGARHAVTGSEADLAGKVAIGLPPSLGQVLTLPLVKAFRERYRAAELTIMEALSVPLQDRPVAAGDDRAHTHRIAVPAERGARNAVAPGTVRCTFEIRADFPGRAAPNSLARRGRSVATRRRAKGGVGDRCDRHEPAARRGRLRARRCPL